MSSTTEGPRRRRGFTLVEMLVVVGVIGLLTALLFPALSAARRQQRVVAAQIAVKSIHAAAMAYHDQLLCFPPDTDDYGTGDTPETVTDASAIYRYLGRKIVDAATGKEYGPFLIMKPEYVVDDGSDTFYVDPWRNPFHLDCMHVTMDTKPTSKTYGQVTRVGEPYPPGTADELKLADVRVWSDGPDGKYGKGSNVESGRGSDPDDADNINSWTE